MDETDGSVHFKIEGELSAPRFNELSAFLADHMMQDAVSVAEVPRPDELASDRAVVEELFDTTYLDCAVFEGRETYLVTKHNFANYFKSEPDGHISKSKAYRAWDVISTHSRKLHSQKAGIKCDCGLEILFGGSTLGPEGSVIGITVLSLEKVTPLIRSLRNGQANERLLSEACAETFVAYMDGIRKPVN